jgi:hypothetical protein
MRSCSSPARYAARRCQATGHGRDCIEAPDALRRRGIDRNTASDASRQRGVEPAIPSRAAASRRHRARRRVAGRWRVQAIVKAEAMRGNAARPVTAPTRCLCTNPGQERPWPRGCSSSLASVYSAAAEALTFVGKRYSGSVALGLPARCRFCRIVPGGRLRRRDPRLLALAAKHPRFDRSRLGLRNDAARPGLSANSRRTCCSLSQSGGGEA